MVLEWLESAEALKAWPFLLLRLCDAVNNAVQVVHWVFKVSSASILRLPFGTTEASTSLLVKLGFLFCLGSSIVLTNWPLINTA